MKTNRLLSALSVLVPILTSGVSSYSFAATETVPAPLVEIQKQLLTSELIAFQPLNLKDPKTGEDLLLTQHTRVAYGLQLRIALYDTNGTTRLNRSLTFLPDKDWYSWISDARFNSAGELVVIHTVSPVTSDVPTHIVSINLTKDVKTTLFSGVSRARTLGKVVEPSRSLVAIAVEERKDSKSLSEKVDIVDEATGEVVRTLPMGPSERATFGAGVNGLAKVLFTAWDKSAWRTVDVATGAVTPIQISDEEAHHQIQERETVLGQSFEIKSETEVSLVDRALLFDGHIVRLQTMPVLTELFGNTPQRYAIERKGPSLVVRDLQTGFQVGKTLPLNPAFPTREMATGMANEIGHVTDLLLTQKNKVIVIKEAIVPHSFMPGTVLTYFDLMTGKQLRQQRLEAYPLMTELVEDESGAVIAVEREQGRANKDMNAVIDLESNQVLRKLSESEKYARVMKSESGRAILTTTDEAGAMTFADLKVPSVKTLIALPVGALTGWYRDSDDMNVRTDAHSTTLRSGVLNSPKNLRTERGWVELRVR